MKQEVAIYLAGTIKKEHEKADETYWTERDIEAICSVLHDYHVTLLNPALRSDSLSDQNSVFGRDMLQVFSADVVFVDARDRRGLGVGAEMMWAKMNSIPVITWAPKNSHYIKASTRLLDVDVTDWIHPFVDSLSDAVVSSPEEGAAWIMSYVKNEIPYIRGREYIEQAMNYYIDHQFEKDIPMQKLSSSSSSLQRKIESIQSISLKK